MRSLLFIGFNGHLNLGDDLMTRCLSWCAREHWGAERVRATSFYRFEPDPGRGVVVNKLFGMLNNWLLRRQAGKSDVLVFGGGSMYHSANSCRWKGDLARRFGKARGARHASMTIGVGLGPFREEGDFEACKATLNSMELVLVRDRHSLRLASEMNLDVPVHLCADPAFLLPEAVPSLLSSRAETRQEMLWIIRPDSAVNSGGMSAEQCVEAMQGIREGAGCVHRMVVFNSGPTFADSGFARKVTDLGGPSLVAPPLFYDGNNMDAILLAIRQARGVVASRLHGILTSRVLGTPVLPLSYHMKCNVFAEELGLADRGVQEVGDIDVGRLVKDAVDMCGSGPALFEPTEEMRQRMDALKHLPLTVMRSQAAGEARP